MEERPLLMIPGPIEIADAVIAAYSTPPPSHVSADVIRDFGDALRAMRAVWCADEEAQPFVVPGSGTLAMEMAAANLVDPGEAVLLVHTGFFSERMGEMLRRRGADVTEIKAEPGGAPDAAEVEAALGSADFKALFATHVDTSTGVRVDAEALADAATRHGALSVFDGVCATAAERLEMAAWEVDVYLTASQKAIGLPAGLALLVASDRAMKARESLGSLPPMSIDFAEWTPIMRAYEAGKPSYFSTPATTLISALRVSLEDILRSDLGADHGMPARFAQHQRAADALRAAWDALDLTLLPAPGLAANTLSAIRYPAGVDATMVGSVRERGVIIAGGLHPDLKHTYFRVGHMGRVVGEPERLLRTVEAIGLALAQHGHERDVSAALDAVERQLHA
jgi:alanine-glyoxylate transaminase/serine-glyoxylate transaminase/serine-pyruvate transaminase